MGASAKNCNRGIRAYIEKTTEQAKQPESVVVPSHVNLVSVGMIMNQLEQF